MKALILTSALTLSACLFVYSQDKKSVVIGTMIDKPNAILVINPPNGDQGFLLPQLSTAQRLSIAPASPGDDGLMVYDITDKSFYYWSGNAWIKGLGVKDAQALAFDESNQTLSLSNGGGEVKLSTLKEIPPLAANQDAFLTTDGTTLKWSTISSLGDITSIVAGQGLTGGGTTGDITLKLNTDGSTIGFTGTDQLQVLDNAISSPKIQNNAVTPSKIQPSSTNNQILVTIGGTVAWVDQNTLPLSIATDGSTITGNGTGGSPLQIGTIDGTHISDGTIKTLDIEDNAITTSKIQDHNVSPIKLQPGGANQILVTNAAGTDAQWVPQTALTPNIAVDGITVTGDGAGIPLAVGNIAGSNIIDESVDADDIKDLSVSSNEIANNAVDVNKLAANSVNSSKIADGTIIGDDITDNSVQLTKLQQGAANQVLVTNGSGSQAIWVNQNTLIPNITVDGATISGNGSTIPLAVNAITGAQITDGTIQTNDLEDDAVDGNKLADAAVSSNHIVSNSVTLDKIAAGSANQVLVTDGTGTDPIWVNQNTLVPNIAVTAPTLTGNGTAGSPLAVGTISTSNIPNNTIETADLVDDAVDGNKLADAAVSSNHIVSNSVTLDKIAAGSANQVLVTDGTGTDPIWVNQNTLVPNIAVTAPTLTGNGTAGNPLAVGTISTSNIPNNTIETADLADDAVDGNKLADASVSSNHIVSNSVTLDKIAAGSANQVLVTDGTGTDPIWVNQNTLVPNIAVTAPTLTGNGTAGNPLAVGTISTSNIPNNTIETADLADDAVDGNKLADASVSSNHIVSNSVTLDKIAAGSANQVLVTDGTGTDPIWVNQNTLVPNIAVTAPTLTGNGTAGNPLAVGTITGAANITDGSVLNADLALASVGRTNIIPEGTSKVLAIDGTGTVVWSDRSSFADNQNLSLSAGNILSIDRGVSVDLNDINATGPQIQGNIDALAIVDGTVTTNDVADGSLTGNDIFDGSISSADIQDGTIVAADINSGGNNKVLTTTGGGTVGWTDQSALPIAGDVTGTLAATTVTRIQNRNVSNTAPADGQTLIWNNATSTWVPGPIIVSPTAQFYSIDPSAFQSLVSSNSNENLSGLFETNAGQFVAPAGEAREIIAPVNLPQGAVITNVTAYYVDNELGSMRISLERKPFAGAVDEIGFYTTVLLSVVITSNSFTIPIPAEAQIDNSTYTYRIHVQFNNLLDVNSAALALSRLHGIRIDYTK